MTADVPAVLDMIGRTADTITALPLDDVLVAVTGTTPTATKLSPAAYADNATSKLNAQRDLVAAAIAFRDAVGKIRTTGGAT